MLYIYHLMIILFVSVIMIPVQAIEKSNRAHLLQMADEFRKALKFDQAADCYLNLLKEDSTNYQLAFDAAFCLYHNKNYKEAFLYFDKCHKMYPHNSASIMAMHAIHEHYGQTEKSIEMLEKNLALNPSLRSKHILQCRYMKMEAIEKLKSRWPDFNACPWQNLERVRGKKILIRLQGGIGAGDVFMFMRWTKLLKEHGAFVIVEMFPNLIKLLSLCPYVDKFVTKIDESEYDELLPITQEGLFYFAHACIKGEIQQKDPYIYAHPDRVIQWKNILDQNKNLKVGLCWLSSFISDQFDRIMLSPRALDPLYFAPFKEMKNISFYSLQKDPRPGYEAPDFVHIFNNIDRDGAFMDTAAIIKSLDLVITVDTSIAHLAGALGAPVWLLLSTSSDYRWFYKRTDCPWYPSMRIFRAKYPDDWSDVIAQVMVELEKIKYKDK